MYCDELTMCGGWGECVNGHQDRVCNLTVCDFEVRKECEVVVPVSDVPVVEPIVEPVVCPVVDPVVCPVVEPVVDSSWWDRFVWWKDNTAQDWVRVVWREKYFIGGCICALVALWSLIKLFKGKPKPVPGVIRSDKFLEPRLHWLYSSIVKGLRKGYDKYFMIEYWKKEGVNDEDLEKVFAYIEG